MDKILLKTQDIKKELLSENGIGCSVFFILLPLTLFFVCFIVGIYLSLNGSVKIGVGSLGTSFLMLFISFIFAKMFGMKNQILRRKNILNNNLLICKDICHKKEVITYESDGLTNKYVWHFKNTHSQISKIESHKELFESTHDGVEFWLVFVDGEKNPTLFYSAENYEIVL